MRCRQSKHTNRAQAPCFLSCGSARLHVFFSTQFARPSRRRWPYSRRKYNASPLRLKNPLRALTDLEGRLYTLSEFVARSNGTLTVERADFLGALWTMLGGNRHKIQHVDGHIFLLNSLDEYRRRPTTHVSAALLTLQGMSEDIEDLRVRVAAPALMGERISVEVHLNSIRGGLVRLQADRTMARLRGWESIRRIVSSSDNADNQEIWSAIAD